MRKIEKIVYQAKGGAEFEHEEECILNELEDDLLAVCESQCIWSDSFGIDARELIYDEFDKITYLYNEIQTYKRIIKTRREQNEGIF